MKLLTRLIHAMEKEDLRNFRLYADRIRSDQFDRKMMDLFESIQEGEDEDGQEIRRALYPTGNSNAYYRLKNRLLSDIQRSLLMLHHELDPQTRVLKYIMLARWCQYRTEWEGARVLLERAAKICDSERIPRWHVLVYEELLALSREDVELDPEPIVLELRRLDREYQDLRRYSQTLAIVSHKLRRTNLRSPDQDVLEDLTQIRSQLGELADTGNPDLQWELNQVVREILLERQDYVALETYLIDSYQKMNETGAFTKAYLREKIVLISWIVNTLSQNRKFEDSLTWTALLKEVLEEQNQRYYQTFLWTYHQALMVNHTCLGKLDDAVKHLEDLVEQSMDQLPQQYVPYVKMNLFRLYLYQGDIRSCMQTLTDMFQNGEEKELDPKMILSSRIAEILLRIEDKDWEFAAYKYKEVRRKFRKLFEDPAYSGHLKMIQLIRVWIKQEVLLPNDKLAPLADAFLRDESISFRTGEFINYKAWVYVRVYQESYFQTVQNWMKTPPDLQGE